MWAYEEVFDDMRKLLRTGARDSWLGVSPTRDELEDLMGRDPWLAEILFEASISDVLDHYLSDQRLKDALFGQGVIGAYAGPKDWGTASVKLMHYQGDLEGQGPVWGYVEGGMGMVSFAIADAAVEAGAVLAAGTPVAEIVPGEGVRLEGGELIRAGCRAEQRRPEAGTRPPRARCRAGDLPGAHRRLADPLAGGEAERRADPPAVVHRGPRRDLALPVDDLGHRRAWRRPSGASRPASGASRASATGRSTSRPASTLRRRPRATT